jgi:hypothetical protein
MACAGVLLFAVSLSIGEPAAQGPSFRKVVQAHFAEWDLNHNGRLEGQEIDRLMNRRSIRGEAAAALAVLKLRERRIPAADRPGFVLSKKDLTHLDRLGGLTAGKDSAPGAHSHFHAEDQFRRNLRALATMVPRLYAGSGPSFRAMRQGAIGDCYFFSMTGYLAARSPGKIRRMIVPQPNGSYLVRFLEHEIFTVAAPTEAELLVNNSSTSLSDGTWLCVLEKAVGKRMRLRTESQALHTAEATDAMASGGQTGQVIQLYSGHKPRTIPLRNSRTARAQIALLRRELPSVLAEHRLAGVEMGREPPPGQAKIPGFGYHHSYAILGFNPRTNIVTLWNPWGQEFRPKGPDGVAHGFTTKHGVFQIQLKTLYQQFSRLILETREPAGSNGSKPGQSSPRH